MKVFFGDADSWESFAMIAEECSITRLVDQAHVQLRQVYTMCNRVSAGLSALNGAGEESAEGGWRREAI